MDSTFLFNLKIRKTVMEDIQKHFGSIEIFLQILRANLSHSDHGISNEKKYGVTPIK